jgi:DNA repair protein RecO
MKYKKLTGIILKKQNYREADQILTLFTKEGGKVRVLGKALRQPLSKMLFAAQDLSEVEINLVGKNFPTLIGIKPLRQFQSLKLDLKKVAIAFYAAETMLKITADEHPNEEAYNLLLDFFDCLNRLDYSVRYYPILESFCLKLLTSNGFSIEHASSSFKIPKELDSDLSKLENMEFESFQEVDMNYDRIEQLHGLINRFIEYVLERNIKSEIFLWTI